MTYDKNYIIDRVWLFSKYHSILLQSCEYLRKEEEGHATMILLMNILEMASSYALKSEKNKLCDIFKSLHENKIITDIEYKFLNGKKDSIRILRNIYMHKDVPKYNIIFNYKNEGIGYPISENENNTTLYDELSLIIFNLIFKIMISEEALYSYNDSLPILDKLINEKTFSIVELTSNQMLRCKGYKEKDITLIDKSIRDLIISENKDLSSKEIEFLVEKKKMITAENSSDIAMLEQIFKSLLAP